ncbi:MAG TPA: PAS domain S-box protein [Longimicrobiales bacterium]|nr:PAS domain S-box protein [Longimicrobiales bacterium]
MSAIPQRAGPATTVRPEPAVLPADTQGSPDSAALTRFREVVVSACERLHAPAAVLTLVQDGEARVLGSVGLPEDVSGPELQVLPVTLQEQIATLSEPLVIHGGADVAPAASGLQACVAVPVHGVGGGAAGVLAVLDGSSRTWSEDDVRDLQDLAGSAAADFDHVLEQRRIGSRPRRADGLMAGLLLEAPMFRQLVEQSLVGIALIQDNYFRYVNPRLAEIFGYTVEQMYEMSDVLDVVLEEDREMVAENMRKRLSGEIDSMRYSFRGRRRDGSVVLLETHGTRTELDGRPAVISTVLDMTGRRRAEQNLRRREEHFRSLIENAWDIIEVVDEKDIIRYISPSVNRVLGYRPQEMVGHGASEFLHPDDIFESRAAFQQAIEQSALGEPLELRLRHRRDGWRTVELRGKLVDGHDGETLAIVNAHDVTGRRRTERALRKNEERYRLVLHATNSAIWDWDVRSGSVFWNGDSYRMLRYVPEEMKPRIEWWYDRVHPEERARVVGGLHAALGTMNETWTTEHRFLRGDGVYATVLNCCHISRDADGNASRVIGSMQDVSTRRAAEDAQAFLARAASLLDENLDHEAGLARLARLVVPALADYCTLDLLDEDRMLHRVAATHVDPGREPALLQRTHRSLDDDPDRHAIVRVARTREPVLVAECTDAMLEAIGRDPEHLRRLRETRVRSLMIVPLTAHDAVLGTMTMAMSESERHYSAADLILAQELAAKAALAVEHGLLFRRAQQAVRARDEVLGIVSHDLRNPLNLIQLSAGMLLDAGDERRSSHTRPLEIINRSVAQMNRMIGDLLDLSSIEARSFSIDPREHDLSELVAEADALLRPLAAEKAVQLSCMVESGLPPVRMDAHQVLRVLSNLGGNAIKFTPANGTVTIRVDADTAGVRFMIADTGPGIPPENLPHVFNRFWQARKGDRRGVGLGLAIARGIVEAHGGRIWAESHSGAGATFYFTLPAVTPGDDMRAT